MTAVIFFLRSKKAFAPRVLSLFRIGLGLVQNKSKAQKQLQKHVQASAQVHMMDPQGTWQNYLGSGLISYAICRTLQNLAEPLHNYQLGHFDR